jgi:hypothetical protein
MVGLLVMPTKPIKIFTECLVCGKVGQMMVANVMIGPYTHNCDVCGPETEHYWSECPPGCLHVFDDEVIAGAWLDTRDGTTSEVIRTVTEQRAAKESVRDSCLRMNSRKSGCPDGVLYVEDEVRQQTMSNELHESFLMMRAGLGCPDGFLAVYEDEVIETCRERRVSDDSTG